MLCCMPYLFPYMTHRPSIVVQVVVWLMVLVVCFSIDKIPILILSFSLSLSLCICYAVQKIHIFEELENSLKLINFWWFCFVKTLFFGKCLQNSLQLRQIYWNHVLFHVHVYNNMCDGEESEKYFYVRNKIQFL